MSWNAGEVPAGGERADVLADIVRVRVYPKDLDLTHGGSKTTHIYGFFFWWILELYACFLYDWY